MTPRITQLLKGVDGKYRVLELQHQGKKRKKVASDLRPMERDARKGAKTRRRFAARLLERHERSGRKKKDGFMKDLWWNVARAWRKTVKD